MSIVGDLHTCKLRCWGLRSLLLHMERSSTHCGLDFYCFAKGKLNANRGGRISGLCFHGSSCEWESEVAATRVSGSLPGDLSKHQSTSSTSLTWFRFRRMIWSSPPGWPKSEGVSKHPPAFAPLPIPPVGPWRGDLQGGHQTTNLL